MNNSSLQLPLEFRVATRSLADQPALVRINYRCGRTIYRHIFLSGRVPPNVSVWSILQLGDNKYRTRLDRSVSRVYMAKHRLDSK